MTPTLDSQSADVIGSMHEDGTRECAYATEGATPHSFRFGPVRRDPTTSSGRIVRNYVHAMADSQAFTLLSEVLYDVSSRREYAFVRITPATTRRPLQLIGASIGPPLLLTFHAVGPIATFAGAQAACRRRAGPSLHHLYRESRLSCLCAALDFQCPATSSARRRPAAASCRARTRSLTTTRRCKYLDAYVPCQAGSYETQ